MKYPSLPCAIEARKFKGPIPEKNVKFRIAGALFRKTLDEDFLEFINSCDDNPFHVDDDYVYKVYNEALKIIEKEKVIKQLSYIELNSEKAEVYKKIREEFANGLTDYRSTAYELVKDCGYKAEDVTFVLEQLEMQEEAVTQAELNADIDFLKNQNVALQMQIKQLKRELAEKTSSSVVVQQAAPAPVQWEYMALNGWELSGYKNSKNSLEGLNKLGREGWEPVDNFHVHDGTSSGKDVFKRIRRDPPSR